jgi:hypothetical protein
MNSKQRETLEAVFADPVSPAIPWADIESLLKAADCALTEGAGSRVKFEKSGEVESFHPLHPAKEAKRYQVRMARAFLIRLGIAP